MTPLEALWAATSETEADAARADAWASLEFPITYGEITVSSMTVALPVIEFHGEGGTLDWPLRLVHAPIGLLDEAGTEVAADGSVWRTDPLGVLCGVLEHYA